jgi:cob(I)alamin adenosyltransferase
MNANELAVYLEDITDWEESPYRQAANMLRQQAKELDEAGHMIGVLREYISDLENGLDSSIKLNKAQVERTHPVKELTDEEIEGWIVAWAKDLYKTLYVEPTDHQRTMAIKMARAILRKAQEK